MSVLLLVASVALCVAQQVQFLTPLDDSSYTTDGQIAVQIKQTQPFAATDNAFKIRFRLCKVLIGGCFDDYQIQPVAELAQPFMWTDKTNALTLSFACNHSWVSSDKYLVTIESTTTSFRAQSDKFEVRNALATVAILSPADGAVISYYNPTTVKWKATNPVAVGNSSDGFRVTLLSAADGSERFSGDVVPTSEYQIVLQESDAPVGMYELRVTQTSNRDVYAKINVRVAQPAAKIRVITPAIDTVWTVDSPATITWETANIKGDVQVELYNGGAPFESLANSSSGSFMLAKVPSYRSGFGFQLRLSGKGASGEEIETFSSFFQLRSASTAVRPGLCVVNDTNTQLVVCRDPNGLPLMNVGTFALFEMKFLWQTCVSLVGTTLDISVKYTYDSVLGTDVQDNHNFLPMDNDRDIVVLDGKSSPHTLIARLRNLVKGTKQPGLWNFTTDISITPFEALNGSEVLLGTGLRFVTTNPECKNLTLSNAPTRCDPTVSKNCTVPAPAKQQLFEAGKKVCSSFQIGALDAPCGETIVFTKTRSSEIITATTGFGEPCGGVFYVEVTNSRAKGWVPSTTVGVCPPPKIVPQTTADAAALTLATMAGVVSVLMTML